MESEFENILQEFKGSEVPEDIIPILDDETVQKMIVAWPKIVVKSKEHSGVPPGDKNSRWLWLWEHVDFVYTDLVDISGIPGIKFERVFFQVKGNRLIYPDGTISTWASKYLKQLIAKKIKGVK